MRPSYLRGLTARKSGAESIERRGRRVVVGDVGTVSEAIPDAGPIDDAAGPNLAGDHDSLAGRNDPDGAVPGGGPGALADDIGAAIRMAHRCGSRRKHDRPDRCGTDEVDVAGCLGRALPVPQVVRPVVLLNRRLSCGINRHDVGDVPARPGATLPAVPDSDRTDGWMGVDDVADGGRGRVPRPAIPEERRLTVGALQSRSVKDDPLLAQSKCSEGRAIARVEAPPIQQVRGAAIRIIVDPGGAHGYRRNP